MIMLYLLKRISFEGSCRLFTTYTYFLFAAVVITSASSGHCLIINVNMGRNKLFYLSTYMVVFLMTGCISCVLKRFSTSLLYNSDIIFIIYAKISYT